MLSKKTTTARLLGAVAAVAIAGAAFAAPINYGDFSDIPPGSVMYLDVTETANTPGDTEPQFGAPAISTNQLDFDPAGFAASSTNGVSDITDGQLNFTLMGDSGQVITSFSIFESGDYSLLGTGTAATQVIYSLSVSSVTVLEIDGVALGTPINLASASSSGGDDLSQGIDAGSSWSLGLTYDVNAALAQSGANFTFGATKLEIVLNDTLVAISEDQSVAFIAKKDFKIDTETDVPEPGSIALLTLGGLILSRRRRG